MKPSVQINESALTFLILGDLHGTPRCADTVIDAEPLFDALRRDVTMLLTHACTPIDMVLVTGDVVYTPSAEAYALATHTLDRVLAAASCERAHLFMVPGNHDIDRIRVENEIDVIAYHDTIRRRPARLERVLDRYPTTLARPFEHFGRFASQFARPSETRSGGGVELPWFVHRFRPRGHAVRLLGWNTVLASDAADEPGSLAISARMLGEATEADDDEFVVVLAHHPFEWLADGDAVRALLNGTANLYVNAHAHDPHHCPPARTAGGLLALSVGGASFESDMAAAEFRYALCRIELAAGEPLLRVWARTSSILNPGFGPDTRAYGRNHDAGSWLLPLRRPRDGWTSTRPSVAPLAKPSPPATITRARGTSPSNPRFTAIPSPRPTAPPASPRPAPSTLPIPSGSAFVGRATLLDAIAEQLRPNGGLRAAMLCGPSGEGKTSLANQVGLRVRASGEFVAGTFWLDARSPQAHYASWHLCLDALGEPLTDESPVRTFARAIQPRGAALLIVDGASPAALTEVLDALRDGDVSVLATSTDHTGVTGSAIKMHLVAPLSLEESVEILQRGETATNPAYTRIARVLGRNAMALELAACALSEPQDPAQFADELARTAGSASSSTENVVYPLFERLWSLVDDEVRTAWVLASVALPDSPLPLAWIENAARMLVPGAGASVSKLTRHGVGRVDAAGATLRLHHLAHTFGRTQFDGLDEESRENITRALAFGAAIALETTMGVPDRTACIRALPHLEMLAACCGGGDSVDISRIAAAALWVAVRVGSVTHLQRVRSLLDEAFEPEALGHLLRRDQALQVLSAIVEFDRLNGTADDAIMTRNEARLATLLRAEGGRASLERARALMVGVVTREALTRGEFDLVVAEHRAELAAVLLDIGSVETLTVARDQLVRVREATESAGPASELIADRAAQLANDVARALKNAQAAGLRR